MKHFTAILYDRSGFEITRADSIAGKTKAKALARSFLAEEFAQSNETTHERWQTMKVSVFSEGEPTGADSLCEWDEFHPQHAKWQDAQPVDP